MKIKLSYLPEEELQADADLAVLKNRHPAAKVQRSDRHPPYRHIYLSTARPPNREEKPCTRHRDVV